MPDDKYGKYNATILALAIIGFLLSIVLSIIFLYFAYTRAQKRVSKAQQDATNAAKALCSSVLATGNNSAGALIRNELSGTGVESACRSLLA